jgi:hypothetical protein
MARVTQEVVDKFLGKKFAGLSTRFGYDVKEAAVQHAG